MVTKFAPPPPPSTMTSAPQMNLNGTAITPMPAAPPPPAHPVAAKAPLIGKPKRQFMAPRIVLIATSGFGKTTCAAYAPNPLVLQARGETGYETLFNAGRAPEVDCARIDEWPGFLALLDSIKGSSYQTIALDALGGFERLCHEHVCERDFKGKWSDNFMAYWKGYKVSVADWLLMLARLDVLKDEGKTILMLCHSGIHNYKNPLGPDYDRFVSDVEPASTWAVTEKWADAVLFGNFLTIVDTQATSNPRKGKGIGDDKRVIYTEHRDAYDAKNRYGMPSRIDMPDDHPELMWNAIWQHIRKEQPNAAATS